MKFEEALQAMRDGKKVRNPFFKDDEYLMACRMTLMGMTKEEIKDMPLSVTKMKGEYIHPDMKPNIIFPEDRCSIDHELHRFPQLNLLLIMRDDWEIVE